MRLSERHEPAPSAGPWALRPAPYCAPGTAITAPSRECATAKSSPTRVMRSQTSGLVWRELAGIPSVASAPRSLRWLIRN